MGTVKSSSYNFNELLINLFYKSYVVCGERFGPGQIRCGIYHTNKIAAETIQCLPKVCSEREIFFIARACCYSTLVSGKSTNKQLILNRELKRLKNLP
jgi:hypothetical protein